MSSTPALLQSPVSSHALPRRETAPGTRRVPRAAARGAEVVDRGVRVRGLRGLARPAEVLALLVLVAVPSDARSGTRGPGRRPPFPRYPDPAVQELRSAKGRLSYATSCVTTCLNNQAWSASRSRDRGRRRSAREADDLHSVAELRVDAREHRCPEQPPDDARHLERPPGCLAAASIRLRTGCAGSRELGSSSAPALRQVDTLFHEVEQLLDVERVPLGAVQDQMYEGVATRSSRHLASARASSGSSSATSSGSIRSSAISLKWGSSSTPRPPPAPRAGRPARTARAGGAPARGPRAGRARAHRASGNPRAPRRAAS